MNPIFVVFIVRILTVVFLWCAPNTALAQILVPEINLPVKHRILINMGLEPEWVTTIGYSHLMNRYESNTKFYLGGSVKFAPLIFAKGAWRLNFTQAVDRQLTQKWKGIITHDIYLAHNKNRAGTMNALGFELRAATLHDGGQWTKGVEAGWQHTALTHIRHSGETKDTFNDRFPDDTKAKGPVDGWYGNTANRFRLGFLTSRSLGDYLSLQIGVGSVISIQKQGILLSFAHAQVPLYFNTQLIYGW